MNNNNIDEALQELSLLYENAKQLLTEIQYPYQLDNISLKAEKAFNLVQSMRNISGEYIRGYFEQVQRYEQALAQINRYSNILSDNNLL